MFPELGHGRSVVRMLRRSRGGKPPEFLRRPSPETPRRAGEGDGAPGGAASLVHALRRGARIAVRACALRRSIAASLQCRAALFVDTEHGCHPSASQSQGAVVPPGGTPTPPERAACEAAPAGAARPASGFPR
jgi:hypothetical protein